MDLHPKPSRADLENIYGDYAALYQKEAPYPPGLPLPITVSPFQIHDESPEMVEAEVCRLRSQKDRVYTHLSAKHLKVWLRAAYQDRETTPPKF